MKFSGAIFATAICLCSSLASAGDIYLYGTIGGAPVFADITNDKGNLDGFYYYMRYAKAISIGGKRDAGGAFTLTTPGANAETLQGTVHGTQWTGTWKSADGKKTLPIALIESHDTLASLNGNYKCDTKEPEPAYGYTFDRSLWLNASKGHLMSFGMSQYARGNGDDQGCSIALSDLKQVPSDNGILLHAKEDHPSDNAHCAVRMIAAGDYIIVSANDCESAGDTMFCTARGGGFSSMFLNRKTGACKAEQ
jgi:hypothetical protein